MYLCYNGIRSHVFDFVARLRESFFAMVAFVRLPIQMASEVILGMKFTNNYVPYWG